MLSYFVYKLKCSDNSYTYKRKPIEIKFYETFYDVLQAISFEKKIKKWTRAKKKALINGNFDTLQILAACRNATHYKYFDK